MIRELELGFRRDTVSALLAAHDGTVRSRLLPDVKDETGKLHHALELSAIDLDPIVLHIDPATHLIAKQMYVVGGPGQPLVEELFSDYRPVDAVQIAFLAKVRRGGQLILERRITEHQDQRATRFRAVQTPRLLNPRILLSCGEPSGDLYAGALTRELRSLAPGIAVAGLGGPELAAAGAELIADYRGLAVTGLTEALAKVPRSFRLLRTLVRWARDERPHALVAIDFPDFNFPLARRVRKLGIRVVYYVSPQIWAWRPGRLKTIRKRGGSRAGDFSVRRGDLPARRRARGVRGASAGRSREAVRAARRLSPRARPGSRWRRPSPSCPAAGPTKSAGFCRIWSRPASGFARRWLARSSWSRERRTWTTISSMW